jgi:hypothetical protein
MLNQVTSGVFEHVSMFYIFYVLKINKKNIGTKILNFLLALNLSYWS